MKICYTNKPMNRQRGVSPSLKTIILMTCVVASMVAIKVIYNPADTSAEIAAMAEAGQLQSESEDSESPETTDPAGDLG